jgi:trimethylamine---corrinoid protein Co-methyltransferase
MIPDLKLLSKDDIALILEKVLTFLSEKGVKIRHRGVLKTLDEGGAWVDFDSQLVRFPRGIIERCLEDVPKHCLLAAQDQAKDMSCPSHPGSFYMCGNTGASRMIDPETGALREVLLSDVVKWGHLLDSLNDIHSSGFQTPADVPPQTVDVHSLKALLENSSKHIWIQPHREGSIKYLIALAVEVTGGEEKLRKRPVVSIITDSLSPFEFKSMDMEAMVQACRYQIPIHISSLPVAGATAPVTIGGSLLVMGIEILAQLIIAQLIKPGTPTIGLSAALTMNMITGRASKASVEGIRANAAFIQFMKEVYHIPTHCAGLTTDSPLLDAQSMIERSVRGLMVAASGADILGRAGELEAAKIVSPLQLIIDDEITGMLKAMISRLGITEETLAWDDLMAIPPGGNFLMQPHTLAHCRDAFRPRLFMRREGDADLFEQARERYSDLMKKEREPILSDHVRSQMDLIVQEADRELIH